MRFRSIVPAILVLALGTALPAQADWLKPSKADQVKLGQRAAEDIRKKEKVLPATDWRVETLRRIASKLLRVLPASAKKEPWQYSFDVIDSKEINAFALPGGPVFFYTGLLDLLKTEDQVAGILAHELTHVRKEHWASAYADYQRRQLGLTAILIFLQPNDTLTNVLSIGNDLILGLPYSRRHETEADEMGVDLMAEAGYNPEGLADSFRTLQEKSKGQKAPEFLSTHPDDKNRIQKIQDRAAKMHRTFPPQTPLKG
jgi:predicted Zn-dependent protease